MAQAIELSTLSNNSPEEKLLWTSADLELMPDNGNRYEIIICQNFPV